MSQAPVTELPTAHHAAPELEKKNPYVAFATRAGFGVIVIAFLLWHYDARPVLRILGRENATCFIATIVIYVAGQVMSAWRWQLLAAVVGARSRFRDFFDYYFVGLFTNLFIPGMLGGDALRSLYLGRKTHRMGEAIASVVADRGTGVIALFWLAAFMVLFVPSGFSPALIKSVIVIGAIGLILVLASPLIAMAVPYMPRMLRRGFGVALPYMRRPQTMFSGLSLSVVLQVSLGIAQWILALGLGLSTPLSVFLLCVPLANVAAGFPVTLNGLGVRETAYLVLFGMAGMGRNDAIALGLLWFAATLLGGLTGAIAFALTEFPEANSTLEAHRPTPWTSDS